MKGEARLHLDGTVFEPAADDLRSLSRARLLITGGTGFVGKWMLELFAWATATLALEFDITVLSRDPEGFSAAFPRLASGIRFERGDVRALRDIGAFDGIIHAATSASAALLRDRPAEMRDTIVSGGASVLALAERSGPIPFLLTSSGAVYGDVSNVPFVDESSAIAPDVNNAYAEGKRLAEAQCVASARAAGVRPKIARMFAFGGPYLPLDAHFAFGNFIADGLASRAIRVAGNGRAVRSYLFGADMAVWLLAVFVRGLPLRAYNVGSEEAIDVASLARIVAERTSAPGVVIGDASTPIGAAHRYVPSTARIRGELGVVAATPLAAAIDATVTYHRAHAAHFQEAPVCRS